MHFNNIGGNMKKFKKTVVLGLTIAMGLLTVACGKDVKTNNESGTEATTSPTKVVSENENGSGTDKGNNAENESSSESDVKTDIRVVASSVAVVQILDKLGVPMVGVPTSSYELPKSVADAEKIGSAMSPDMEIIASLSPDIIVSVDIKFFSNNDVTN